MRIIFLTAVLFIIFPANKAVAQPPAISLDTVITGLSLPMQMVSAGDSSGRLFIVQKAGVIKVYSKTYSLLGTFLTVTVNSSANERGLLSMAFHPDYKNNGFFFVYYNNANGDLELARFKVSAGNPDMADAASQKILITIPHPTNNNHNGGTLHFGKDGFLYLSTGDGGGSNDVPNNAQTTTVLLGKILRFGVNTSDVAPYYSVPADNPFGNEVYAYGLRNPFRWSFDSQTGDMWIGDVGQDKFEEIDFRPADSAKGANYGWRCFEGNVTGPNTSGCGPASNYIFPVYTYPTTTASSIAITGGVVYRGSAFTDLQGYYIASEYYTGDFFKIKHNGNTFDTSKQKSLLINVSNFAETEEGELYAVTLGTGTNGRVIRLLQAALCNINLRVMATGVMLLTGEAIYCHHQHYHLSRK
jgi:glucose/arabinose dehydrogenase